MTCFHHYTVCHSVSVSLAAGMRGLQGRGIPKVLPLLCVMPYLSYASFHRSVVPHPFVCLLPITHHPHPPLLPTALLLSNPAYHLFLATYAQPMGRPAFPPPNRVKPINTNGKEGAKLSVAQLGTWVATLQAWNILPTAISSSSFFPPPCLNLVHLPLVYSMHGLTPLAQNTFNLQLCRFCNTAASGWVGGWFGAEITCRVIFGPK